jgi:hypothetical protein
MSVLGAAMAINCGTKVFATPTGTPFEPLRFAVVTDTYIDIKGKNGLWTRIREQCEESYILSETWCLALGIAKGAHKLD